jgi:sarcosine oxidase subunit delta
MLLIHCPFCDDTLPEPEFAYAGEAHIARPSAPSALSDEA